MANVLEKFYAATGEVVLRDAANNPSIFVRHPKVNSIMFNSELLPDTVHSAFVVDEDVDNAVYIGKFKASAVTGDNALLSLPNAPAVHGLGGATLASRIAEFGNNTAGLTIADHGLLMLIAQTSDYVVRGNEINMNAWPDGTPWQESKNVAVGDVRIFNGWKYRCLQAHTTGAGNLPPDHPEYWKKISQCGGKPNRIDPDIYKYQYQKALTGSGPVEWYLNHDISQETDFCGDTEFVSGVRVVSGEIQIIPNNKTADPEYTVTEADWRAILPHVDSNAYDLVTPGTEGTLKYNMTGQNAITLDTEATARSTYAAIPFRNLQANANHLPYVPSIAYELGLFPLPNCRVQGHIFLQNATSTMYCSTHGSIGINKNEADNQNGIALLYFTPTMLSYNRLAIRPRSRELAV